MPRATINLRMTLKPSVTLIKPFSSQGYLRKRTRQTFAESLKCMALSSGYVSFEIERARVTATPLLFMSENEI